MIPYNQTTREREAGVTKRQERASGVLRPSANLLRDGHNLSRGRHNRVFAPSPLQPPFHGVPFEPIAKALTRGDDCFPNHPPPRPMSSFPLIAPTPRLRCISNAKQQAGHHRLVCGTPAPKDCELFYVDKDALFSHHALSEVKVVC